MQAHLHATHGRRDVAHRIVNARGGEKRKGVLVADGSAARDASSVPNTSMNTGAATPYNELPARTTLRRG
jgi:hypothetical protein